MSSRHRGPLERPNLVLNESEIPYGTLDRFCTLLPSRHSSTILRWRVSGGTAASVLLKSRGGVKSTLYLEGEVGVVLSQLLVFGWTRVDLPQDPHHNISRPGKTKSLTLCLVPVPEHRVSRKVTMRSLLTRFRFSPSNLEMVAWMIRNLNGQNVHTQVVCVSSGTEPQS